MKLGVFLSLCLNLEPDSRMKMNSKPIVVYLPNHMNNLHTIFSKNNTPQTKWGVSNV